MDVDLDLVLSLAAIVVLLFLSGFFSGSETALTAASSGRMHALAREGNRRASMVNAIREEKDKMIGGLLLGNNLVNILASALATSVLIRLFGEAGVVYATLVMTLMVLIFAEVLPKTYALHHADKMAMVIAPVIRIVISIFSPVTQLVSIIVRAVLKLFGADISIVNVGDHVQVLRGMIEMHQGPHQEIRMQRAMLRSILDLADVDAGEIMVHRKNLSTIDASAPMETIVRQVLESPYTRIPVWQNDPDNIIGVIHARHLLCCLQDAGGNAAKLEIEQILAEPWFIPDSTTLFDQLQEFRRRREHFALVVDEYGALMGIVTLEDILEEIVGEIDDEYDRRVPGVRRQANGTYLVDGTVTIRDLRREYEWRLPDEDYSTLAGLILYETQRIPDAGQSFTFHGFRFDIVKRQRNQITLIRVIPPATQDQEKG